MIASVMFHLTLNHFRDFALNTGLGAGRSCREVLGEIARRLLGQFSLLLEIETCFNTIKLKPRVGAEGAIVVPLWPFDVRPF